MLIIGLTGSIGMGKSTTAAMFQRLGVPVHDSDRAVHDLYAGSARDVIGAVFPDALGDNGIDRVKLSKIVFDNPVAIKQLEQLIHPLVAAHRVLFVQNAARSHKPIVVCDIPLLFETGMERDFGLIALATAPYEVQKQRVLARPHMTESRFHAILAKQMSDAEKRRRAHMLIDTSMGLEVAFRQVVSLQRACASLSNASRD
jgi:dephospho-CoA kinase